MNKSWWLTIAKWQDQRWLWLLGGFIALSFELGAVYFFQEYLGQRPCEMCVYIRFSMAAIFVFAMIAAIYPKNIILKLIGYIGAYWAIVKGILWSWNLEKITLERLSPDYNPFISTCSLGEANFPFGLPLHQWLPSHFMQTGICGEDTWSLFGLNMPEWMLVVFSVFAILLIIMFICWVCRLVLRRT